MTEPAGIRCAYPDLRDGQLHYRSNGRSDLRPLVLLHQTPSDSRMYLALMQRLAEEYWLIAPDNPGFGNSDPLPGGFTLPACAASVAALLDALDIEDCRLFGHHTGASIAVQLASDRPDLASALALSGPPLLDDALRAALPASAAPIEESPDGAHLAAMWARMSGKEGDTPPAILLREVGAAFAAGPSYPEAYAAVIKQPFEQQLSSLGCPVLVFAGTRDVLYPRLEASHALCQRGQLQEIKGAGGYVCDREPDVVAGLLRGFFGNG